MYVFYGIDPKTVDKIEKAQFTPPNNWSGDYQGIKDDLYKSKWNKLGNKKFNPNNKKHVSMLPKLISGTYLWCEKRNIGKIIKKDIETTKLKIELKARGNIKGLAKHLAKKYGPSDEGFFTRCMAAEELADYPHDNRAAICARAHKVQIGTWPGEKKKKKQLKATIKLKDND